MTAITGHAPRLQNWTSALERRHRSLDARVAEEAKRPLPDSLALQQLKRRRLLAKERLAMLQATD